MQCLHQLLLKDQWEKVYMNLTRKQLLQFGKITTDEKKNLPPPKDHSLAQRYSLQCKSQFWRDTKQTQCIFHLFLQPHRTHPKPAGKSSSFQYTLFPILTASCNRDQYIIIKYFLFLGTNLHIVLQTSWVFFFTFAHRQLRPVCLPHTFFSL